ncbi:MAG: ANTAR domain-containing protein, partial [Burkholderiaceae bacterium]
ARRGVVTAASPDVARPAATAPSESVVAMAVGVLMHRFSLARGPALERLRRLAEADRRSPAEQAERVLEAVERLSLPEA